MSDRKPYSSPQIFQVELNHEQAVISACSVGTTGVAAGTGLNGCRASGVCEGPPNNGTAGGCKRSSLPTTCSNRGPRAS